jgi:hypothetical protein
MRTLARTFLLLGCAEFLPLTRRQFGVGFSVWLALAFGLKHQLLTYLPVTEYHQLLNQWAGIALAVHLLGRFFSAKMALRHAGLPGDYAGVPLPCFLGVPLKTAQRYIEPLMVAVFAAWAAGSMTLLRFQPAFFLTEIFPLPYGIVTPFPFWYRENAVLMARLLPVVSALALALYNRLDAPPKADARAIPQEEKLTFSPVHLPLAPAPLPTPSAARMALELQQQHGEKTS